MRRHSWTVLGYEVRLRCEFPETDLVVPRVVTAKWLGYGAGAPEPSRRNLRSAGILEPEPILPKPALHAERRQLAQEILGGLASAQKRIGDQQQGLHPDLRAEDGQHGIVGMEDCQGAAGLGSREQDVGGRVLGIDEIHHAADWDKSNPPTGPRSGQVVSDDQPGRPVLARLNHRNPELLFRVLVQKRHPVGNVAVPDQHGERQFVTVDLVSERSRGGGSRDDAAHDTVKAVGAQQALELCQGPGEQLQTGVEGPRQVLEEIDVVSDPLALAVEEHPGWIVGDDAGPQRPTGGLSRGVGQPGGG